jgi:hypothetical protein
MSNRHWVKAWLRILDDPKLGSLPDETWRFAVECILVAGENGETGHIPEANQLAWRLRKTPSKIAKNLQVLLDIDFLVADDDGTKVKNFAKYQSRVPDAVRKQAQRAKNRKNYLEAE